MAHEPEITIGEVYRAQLAFGARLDALTAEVRARHHELANHVNANLGPIAVVRHQVDAAERALLAFDTRLDNMDEKIDSISRNAAMVSGGIGVAAFVASIFSGFLGGKH